MIADSKRNSTRMFVSWKLGPEDTRGDDGGKHASQRQPKPEHPKQKLAEGRTVVYFFLNSLVPALGLTDKAATFPPFRISSYPAPFTLESFSRALLKNSGSFFRA